MGSTHPREKIVEVIDLEDPEQMEGTQANTRPIDSPFENSPASSSHSATTMIRHNRRPSEHEVPQIPSWTSRASFSNHPLAGSATFHSQTSAAKNHTTLVNSFPKRGNVDVTSYDHARKHADGNISNVPSLVPQSHLGLTSALTGATRSQQDPSLWNENVKPTKPQPPTVIDLEDYFEEEEFQNCSNGQPKAGTIIIDLEDDEEEQFQNCSNGQPKARTMIIDLEDDFEEEDFQNFSNGQPEAGTEEPSARLQAQLARQAEIKSIPIRNLPIAAPLRSLDSFTFSGVKINPKANLELRDGDFLRVIHIIQDTKTSEVNLRGWIFRRTREMNGMLERKLNEVCWILHVDENDGRDSGIQGMESVPVSEVARRRFIRMTNRPFPELSWRENPEESEDVVHDERVLVCRYKYICWYSDARAREQNEWCERALQRLRAEECDSSCARADEAVRHNWRGDTSKGGASKSLVSEEVEFFQNAGAATIPKTGPDPTAEDRHRSNSSPNQPNQLGLQENTNPEFVHATKRQRLSVKSSHTLKSNIIDLTDDEPENTAGLCSLFDKARSAHSKRTGFQLPSSRYTSPEVVEVQAQIDTSCKLGTLRREYQGQITSTYLPKGFNSPEASHYSKQVVPELSNATSPPPMTFPSVQKSNGWSNPSMPPASRPPLQSASQDKSGLSLEVRQRYTFGDCYCGAGGTSRGAVDAGLHVEWGFDFDLPACKSYGLNYIGANVYNVDAHRFSGLTDKDYKVDICHLSPPCQFFSDAHTVQGKDDERNVASLFAVFELLNRAKPRVVTLEQTSGLLRRHPIYFNAVILMFTARSFSIRWRLIDCANYGLPQRRHRLFMIASCPGENLPTFAKPTHTNDVSTQPGLKPWVTINQAISSIPSNCADHDISSTRVLNQIPYNGDSLAKCITTSGGGNVHPSGQRNFTIREFATLQGFPLDQKFFTSGAKRQIGNAVPPIVAKAVLEEIKWALMRTDGVL